MKEPANNQTEASVAPVAPKKSKKDYLKGWVPYTLKRYWTYAAITTFALVMPWIKIGGNHLFLLSFDHKKFHLAGIAFDMQELLPLVFLILFMFIGIFAMTAIGGRVWCGWACPQTIFRVIYRDLIETSF
ncbi:MAG TPA: 4Fe-4S binding protein, partial [Sulfurovum sp.]|nr:4Fe-4S binding protein [Sulfurovum sp.]